jgi:hypothetical protein
MSDSFYEIKRKCLTYMIEMKCSIPISGTSCGGTYVFTGLSIDIGPPLYSHICNKCDKLVNFNKTYPYRVYETESS